jgi:PAS domain-containing protein
MSGDGRLKTELALRKSEERFRLVVESALNAIVMIGPTGVIETVNAQTERVLFLGSGDEQQPALHEDKGLTRLWNRPFVAPNALLMWIKCGDVATVQ